MSLQVATRIHNDLTVRLFKERFVHQDAARHYIESYLSIAVLDGYIKSYRVAPMLTHNIYKFTVVVRDYNNNTYSFILDGYHFQRKVNSIAKHGTIRLGPNNRR